MSDGAHKHAWRKRLTVSVVTLLFLGTTPVMANSTEPQGPLRPFGVADYIAMQRFVPLNGTGEYVAQSPDGHYLVARLRRGDLERDVTVTELTIWRFDNVRRYLNSGLKLAPRPLAVIRKQVSQDWAAVSNVRWNRDGKLTFVALGDNGFLQGFEFDPKTQLTTQRTHALGNVVLFDSAGSRTVYLARTPRPKPPTAIALSPSALSDHIPAPDGNPADGALRLFVENEGAVSPQAIDTPPIELNLYGNLGRGLWISPSGRYAVTLTPATNAPDHWSRYRVFDNLNRGWTREAKRTDPTSFDLIDRLRYQLIDLEDLSVRPLIDAPDGTLAFNGTPRRVFWIDDRRVIVSSTYLPLAGENDAETAKRVRAPAIAEIDVETGQNLLIMSEPFQSAEDFGRGTAAVRIQSIDWDSRHQKLTVVSQARDQRPMSNSFNRIGGYWRPAGRPSEGSSAPTSVVNISVRQSRNERPRLIAAGSGCECERILLDPAPELENFAFGRQERFDWTDATDIKWSGRLIYPVGYRPGRAYPLVIQTHGFSPDQFVFAGDSENDTAFAAQALANSGFFVLQAGEPGAIIADGKNEGERVADGWQRAIDVLAERGLIDRHRVGLTGWSRTGFHVAAMLAFHPTSIAAATISDAVQYNYSQYLLVYGSAFAKQDFERVLGPLSSVSYHSFEKASPFYKMSNSATPLRIEAIGPFQIVAMRETYVQSLASGRATDFIYYPYGSHNLMKPSEVLSSQGGNVDWFRFWLQGFEDRDPSKTEQYLRWRRMQAGRH